MYYTIEKRHLDKSCSLVNVQKVELISFFRFLTAYNKAKREKKKQVQRISKSFLSNKTSPLIVTFDLDMI